MHKIIVAGCGSMAETWIETAVKRNDSKITALVDVNPKAADAKNEKYGLGARVYTDINAALEREDADIVFDITVPQSHFNITTAALKAGRNVFSEKPMSDTLLNAEKMVEYAEKTGREYFVMQNRRYIPGMCAMKDFLKSGLLGETGAVSADFRLGPHFGGFRDEMDNPLIADMAIHTFDAARFITGKNAVSVFCHEFNPSWSWYRGNANANCIFEMEGGLVFDYRGSWCANGFGTSWESEWRISCTGGGVFWDGEKKLLYDKTLPDDTAFIRRTSSAEIPQPAMELTGHEACISDMFAALDKGTRPQTDCRDNINSIRMVYKAIESAKTGKKIKI